MNEIDLINQLLSISLGSHGSKDDTRMMDIGFVEARKKSITIVKEYLLRNGLLIDEVVEMEESRYDLTEEDFLDIERSILEISRDI